MKNSKLFALGFFTLVMALFLVGSVFAGGGDPRPVLRAIPAQSTWIADGMTQYKITLVGDSTPMNGQGTRAIQAGYNVPNVPGYQFNVVSVNTNPSNDFFAGYSTSPQSPYGLVYRGLTGSGVGPVNRVGNFVELYFTVTQTVQGNARSTQTSLEFDSDPQVTYFLRPISQGGNIDPILESVPFTVEPRFRSVAVHAALVACDPEDC